MECLKSLLGRMNRLSYGAIKCILVSSIELQIINSFRGGGGIGGLNALLHVFWL